MAINNWKEEIQSILDEGDDFLDTDHFAAALDKYQQAAALIPEPKYDYDISLPVFTAIGEALFFAEQYSKALDVFKETLKMPGAVENPLSHLRLGQTYYELGDFDRAADELMRAYMLDGEDIFRRDGEKYLAFLATRISL
jgi:tetratricopeptide (TPR) repeat protein